MEFGKGENPQAFLGGRKREMRWLKRDGVMLSIKCKLGKGCSKILKRKAKVRGRWWW
jgi:hypothetical protein